jgi:succinoglycan biosynthesis protein ExoL
MTRLACNVPALLLAYFGHDARETAVQRRILSLQLNGCRVIGFTFARRHQAERSSIPFDNVSLGTTVDRNYLKRLVPLARGLVAALRHARSLREADVIQARNIDMFALAVVARLLSGSKAKLVYEVLDVQRIFIGGGRVSSLIRAVERQLLKTADLLVVSSPDFIKEYFEPVQRYHGRWHLLENKISGSQIQAAPQSYVRPTGLSLGTEPWVIGWFGVLRCRKSLDMLAAIADELGAKVRIYIRGRLSREDISEAEFTQTIGQRPNIVFEGPYSSPEDLARIYENVHFNWSIDYTDAGANSDWLLPNRLYEGGFFGAVALSREATTTEKMVAEHDLGRSFAEPVAKNICDFLRDLDTASYSILRAGIMAKPQALFVDETDTRVYLNRLALLIEQKNNSDVEGRYLESR